MNRTTTHTLVAFAATLLLVPSAALHAIAAEFFLHDGDRVVFLGDSITEGGKYTTYLQAYALTRHPQWQLTFRNVGWRGDTAWLRCRYATDEKALFAANETIQQKMVSDAVAYGLGRDVFPLRPTVVTVSMGMNDSYSGRTEEAYPPFIRAETKIVRVLKDHGVRVALLTPQAMEGSGPPPDLDGGNKALKIFSNGIKDVAAKTGVPLWINTILIWQFASARTPQSPMSYFIAMVGIAFTLRPSVRPFKRGSFSKLLALRRWFRGRK